MKSMDILIVGIGGQGALLAARVLGATAMAEGYDVRIGEVRGLSRRNGSVQTIVRCGEKVFAPRLDAGQADFVLGLEQLEAARHAHILKPGGLMLLSTHKQLPMPTASGLSYPEDIEGKLRRIARVKVIDAPALARVAGDARAANMVMLGALSAELPFSREHLIAAMREAIPEAHLAVNLRALELGAESNDRRH